VVAIGLAVTPMLYFTLHHYRIEAGMMVTASHNPPQFNGFKLACGTATLHGSQLRAPLVRADRRDDRTGGGNNKPDLQPKHRTPGAFSG
jgi:phosphomannomutase/phosphoglucomutase